jgi:hypothetical protein
MDDEDYDDATFDQQQQDERAYNELTQGTSNGICEHQG